MSIPLRTVAFWSIYKLVDNAPMQQSADNVRKASDLRRKAFRLPGAWLITGRAHRGALISEGEAVAADGTVLPFASIGRRTPALIRYR